MNRPASFKKTAEGLAPAALGVVKIDELDTVVLKLLERPVEHPERHPEAAALDEPRPLLGNKDALRLDVEIKHPAHVANHLAVLSGDEDLESADFLVADERVPVGTVGPEPLLHLLMLEARQDIDFLPDVGNLFDP